VVIEADEFVRRERIRALVDGHCGGDPDVFASIVREHSRPLLAQAQRRLGSLSEAEDAVQEAFERAYRGLDRFGGEYRLGAWLSRIVANVCEDHAARRAQQRRLPGIVGSHDMATADASDVASDPGVLRNVRAALDALPDAQRNTFLLHEMDGLSYPQVAEHLGISEDNARARVHRARSALRRYLDRAGSAVAAIFVVPAIRRFNRGLHNRAQLNAATAPTELGVGSPLVNSAGSSLTQVAASPITQFAASVASSARGGLALIATGVVAAVAGVAAVGDAPPTKNATPTEASVSAPAALRTSSASASASVESPAASAAGDIPVWAAPWLPDSSSEGIAAPSDGASAGAATPDCLWADEAPGSSALAAPPASMLGRLSASGLGLTGSAASPAFSANTILEATTPGGASSAVEMHARACFPPSSPVLVIGVAGGGARLNLRGALVSTTHDGASSTYTFRGTVAAKASVDGSGAPAWAQASRFVALLEVDRATKTVNVSIVLLGVDQPAPGDGTTDSPPTSSPPPDPGSGGAATDPGATGDPSAP
jgi:RNA polymerase sigma-70 factor, ECF subfamily